MRLFLLTILLATGFTAIAQWDTIRVKNLVYAEPGDRKLKLDIYRLKGKEKPPLLIWVHGGAWHSGDKENPPLQWLSYGYAVASIDFRQSTESPFPAQIEDIRAAIRYLRSHATSYGYDPDRFIIFGSSSGGHLAALIATTNNNSDLPGGPGNEKAVSSAVQAGIDYYGPTNLLTILNQSTPHGLNVRLPGLALLLGKPLDQCRDLAKQASPVYQADSTDVPLFIVHGEQDIQVPLNQSVELYSTYQRLHLPVAIEFIKDAGHGGNEFFQKELLEKIDRFLKEHL